MEKVLVLEINDETMGFPVDRMSHMAFGPMINDKERVLITGSNNDFGGRPRFTQSLAWLVYCAIPPELPEPVETGGTDLRAVVGSQALAAG